MPTLDWIGKKAVLNHDKEVPFHLLKCDKDLSVGDPGSGNLLVEGDNLVALKALLPYYAGQVKCIYIDPPYNTGNEGWVYNDNVNSPEIRTWLGQVVGREAEDLSRHDKWLCMMYPRISLLRSFLRIDGVILVSIDDFESHHLRALIDEVFGPQNFIAQLVWDKTRKNDAQLFSVGHEYILIYARSLSTLRNLRTRWRESRPGADLIRSKYLELKNLHKKDYHAMEHSLRDWYKSLPKDNPARKHSRYKHIDERGIWRDRDISWPGGGGPRYDVIHPLTRKPCAVPERGWGFATIEKMNEEIEKRLVVFRKDESMPPIRKAYLFPVDEDATIDDAEDGPGPQVMTSVIQKQAQVTAKLLRNMFGGQRVFDNPKDHEVLMRLIRYVSGPTDIVLDAFAGSGSTGHAILDANRIYGDERRFVLVELNNQIARETTRERLKKASEGYSYVDKKGKKIVVPGSGVGFRYCSLGKPIFNDEGNINDEVTFTELATFVYFSETGEPLPGRSGKKPLLGIHNGRAIYLLFNGVLGDRSPNGGNVLTRAILDVLPPFDGPKVVFGNGCRLGRERLKREQITFRQTPYEIRVT